MKAQKLTTPFSESTNSDYNKPEGSRKHNRANDSAEDHMESSNATSAKKPKLDLDQLEGKIRLRKKIMAEREDSMAILRAKAAQDEKDLATLVAMHARATSEAAVSEKDDVADMAEMGAGCDKGPVTKQEE